MMLAIVLLIFSCAKAEDENDFREDSFYPVPYNFPVRFDKVYKSGFVDPYSVLEERHPRKLIPSRKDIENEKEQMYRRPYYPEDFNKENEERKAVKKAEEDVSFENLGRTLIGNVAHETDGNENSRNESFRFYQPFDKDKEAQGKLTGNTTDIESILKLHNWTTCYEFSKDAYFHTRDVLNIVWVPFYIWSLTSVRATAYRFSIPPSRLVAEYRVTYGVSAAGWIDWHMPKLRMHGATKALLVAADQTGLFKRLQYLKNPPDFIKSNINFILPKTTTRLKFEDPYLAMMDCETGLTKLMARLGTEPKTDEDKAKVALSLRMRGVGEPVSLDLDNERNYYLAKKLRESMSETDSIGMEEFREMAAEDVGDYVV